MSDATDYARRLAISAGRLVRWEDGRLAYATDRAASDVDGIHVADPEGAETHGDVWEDREWTEAISGERLPRGSASAYRCEACKFVGVTRYAVARVQPIRPDGSRGGSTRIALCEEHHAEHLAERDERTGSRVTRLDGYRAASRVARERFDREAMRAAYQRAESWETATQRTAERFAASRRDVDSPGTYAAAIRDRFAGLLVRAARRAYPRDPADTFVMALLPGPQAGDRSRLVSERDIWEAAIRQTPSREGRDSADGAEPMDALDAAHTARPPVDRVRAHGSVWSHDPGAGTVVLRRAADGFDPDTPRVEIGSRVDGFDPATLAALPQRDRERLTRFDVKTGAYAGPTGRSAVALRAAASRYVEASRDTDPEEHAEAEFHARGGDVDGVWSPLTDHEPEPRDPETARPVSGPVGSRKGEARAMDIASEAARLARIARDPSGSPLPVDAKDTAAILRANARANRAAGTGKPLPVDPVALPSVRTEPLPPSQYRGGDTAAHDTGAIAAPVREAHARAVAARDRAADAIARQRQARADADAHAAETAVVAAHVREIAGIDPAPVRPVTLARSYRAATGPLARKLTR